MVVSHSLAVEIVARIACSCGIVVWLGCTGVSPGVGTREQSTNGGQVGDSANDSEALRVDAATRQEGTAAEESVVVGDCDSSGGDCTSEEWLACDGGASSEVVDCTFGVADDAHLVGIDGGGTSGEVGDGSQAQCEGLQFEESCAFLPQSPECQKAILQVVAPTNCPGVEPQPPLALHELTFPLLFPSYDKLPSTEVPPSYFWRMAPSAPGEVVGLAVVGGYDRRMEYQGAIVLINVDKTGTISWQKHVGKSAAPYKKADLTQVAPGEFVVQAPTDNGEVLLTRFDKKGQIVWTMLSPVPSDYQHRDLEPLDNGFMVQSITGPNSVPTGQCSDWHLHAFDGDGTLLWSRPYSAPRPLGAIEPLPRGLAIRQLVDGRIVAAMVGVQYLDSGVQRVGPWLQYMSPAGDFESLVPLWAGDSMGPFEFPFGLGLHLTATTRGPVVGGTSLLDMCGYLYGGPTAITEDCFVRGSVASFDLSGTAKWLTPLGESSAPSYVTAVLALPDGRTLVGTTDGLRVINSSGCLVAHYTLKSRLGPFEPNELLDLGGGKYAMADHHGMSLVILEVP